MFRNKKILLTMTAVTVVLTLGATTFIVNAVTNPTDQEQGFIAKKKSSSAQSSSEKSVSSISPKAQSATSSSQNAAVTSSNTGKQGANSSSNMGTSSSTNSSSTSSTSTPSVSNTLTQDDFRSSDDLAYRMIVLYGLAHGDDQWQKLSLMQSKGIILTKVANQSNPTFVAKVVDGTDSDIAYYKYLMNDTSTASQNVTKPMLFSQNSTTDYRASIADVLNYVNSIGGRQAVQKMKFQLVETSN
ncbi:hypothetical protein [Fructobacillus evanidus]|uniref:hypothetical protein n=1 Tax=Fructobacillus evanidus TaxID=3064281 RepID=UPI002DA7E89A|nr:unnamed protein product [Fructobacillus sp. LMG 32999]CAK1252639.1 unnamed protein product [Fructobacillus sp. LMG 32999]CAK1252845.1 unnamed protein product [Fructobacillus sp. LMG 32999]